MREPVVQELTDTYDIPTTNQIISFARRKHVSRILSVETYTQLRETMARVGPVQFLGGIEVSPACGHPPLAGSTS
jgi:hypothetical protein